MADPITISGLSLQYSASAPAVLSSVSLDVCAGACCAVIGPTGAGKSSLLYCLAGTLGKHHPEAVSSGIIQIGRKTFDKLPKQILLPAVGLVLQDPYVQISGVRDTVYDEVLFTLENIGPLPGDPQSVILPLLRDLGIEHLANRKPTTLSGGETQRVALATILVARPPVILLDEPTTALDTRGQERLRDILRSMRSKTTVILTDTQLDFALGVSDQIILLQQGSIIYSGEPWDLLKRMEDFGTAVPLDTWRRLKPGIAAHLERPSRVGSRIARALGFK